MPLNFNRRINPVIPTTAIGARNNEMIFTTDAFTQNLVTPRFVIQLDQSVPFGNTMPTVMSNVDGEPVVMYDRYGNYARADRFYRAIQMRKCGVLPYSGCNPNEFQCVVGFDPVRITVLCDLPNSVYCPTVVQLQTVRQVTVPNVINGGTTTMTSTTTENFSG